MVNSNTKERLHGPDILRGFAATGVIFFHLHLLSGVTITTTITEICGKFGAFVSLFFAISAFSLTYSYHDKLIDRDDFRDFFIKRFFRLAPLFYTVLLAEYIATYVMYKHAFSFYEMLLSITYLFSFVPGKHESLVWGGWSLGVEWIFYVLFPMLICFLTSKRTTLVMWAVFLIMSINIQKNMAITQPEIQSIYYMNIVKHFPYFTVGILMFHYLEDLKRLARFCGNKKGFIAGAIIVMTVMGIIFYYKSGLYPSLYYELVASLIWMLLLSAAILGFPQFLDNKFTRFLGAASYSIYLIHPIVVIGLRTIGFYKYAERIIVDITWMFLFIAMVTIGITFMISWLTFNFIERPGISYGKKIIKKIVLRQEFESGR